MLPYVAVCCRLLVAGVFLLSAPPKIRSRTAFRDFQGATQSLLQLHARQAARFAVLSIACEVAVVILLAVPSLVIAGFAAGGTLLLAYTVAISRALHRGVRTPGRCIGAAADPLNGSLLVRNIALVAVCVIGLWASEVAGAVMSLTTALGASVAIAVFGLVLVASFDDLVYLARRSPS